MDVEEPEHTYRKPNGTNEDHFYLSAGAKLTLAAAKRSEKLLESDPDNLTLRLMLLGFYGHRPSGQDKLLEHMLWMIDERPGDYLSFYLGHEYSYRAFKWTAARVREAGERWLRQVKRHRQDARVLCNAASFFRWHDASLSEKFYKRAKKLDQAMALPARKLAYYYRYLASEAPKSEREILVRLALREADESIKRRDDSPGERTAVLTEFAPTAIKFGHLEQARRFAKRLKSYGDGFYLWNQYAYLYLAWIDLRENRLRGLNFKLIRLRELFGSEPSHVASCNAAVSFVNDALSLGQNSIAQDLLEILIFGCRDPQKKKEKAELEGWLAAIRDKHRPKFEVLKLHFSRLY
jgi:hypothetical protein